MRRRRLEADGSYQPGIALGRLTWHPNANVSARIGHSSNPNLLFWEARTENLASKDARYYKAAAGVSYDTER